MVLSWSAHFVFLCQKWDLYFLVFKFFGYRKILNIVLIAVALIFLPSFRCNISLKCDAKSFSFFKQSQFGSLFFDKKQRNVLIFFEMYFNDFSSFFSFIFVLVCDKKMVRILHFISVDDFCRNNLFVQLLFLVSKSLLP